MPRDPSDSDYEALRGFVPQPPRPTEPPPPDRGDADRKISVMEWLIGVGDAVKRRFRSGVPGSPLARIHARR
jgi:hypothetical protein